MTLVPAFILAAALAAQSQAAHAQGEPKLVPVLPDRTFVPKGFDDNDNAQIVASGDYPNTCYRAGPHSVRVDHDRLEIHVRDTAYYYPEAICLQVRVPYTTVANVGILRSGNYRVIFEGPDGIKLDQEPVPVARALSSEPDDYLYASVADAFVERSSSGNGVTHIVVRGDIRSTCSYLKEIRVIREAGNVLTVLPIAGMDPGPDCSETAETFERRVPLVDPPAKRTLLHVRSLNGQSVNKVIRFDEMR